MTRHLYTVVSVEIDNIQHNYASKPYSTGKQQKNLILSCQILTGFIYPTIVTSTVRDLAHCMNDYKTKTYTTILRGNQKSSVTDA